MTHPPNKFRLPTIVCPIPIPIKLNVGTEKMFPVAHKDPPTMLNEKKAGCGLRHKLMINPTIHDPIAINHWKYIPSPNRKKGSLNCSTKKHQTMISQHMLYLTILNCTDLFQISWLAQTYFQTSMQLEMKLRYHILYSNHILEHFYHIDWD